MKIRDTPLLSAAQIERRVAEMAREISRSYAGREILLLTVLKGGLIFAADLMRRLDGALGVDFVRAKSYQGAESGGRVAFLVEPSEPLENQHILLVEDIVDTGRTTTAIIERLQQAKPASLALCTLLDKPGGRAVPVSPDYTGFVIENQFVVGYGLDYEERYRELPGIYVLEE